MTTYAVIPARAGSRGIPGKNMAPVGGVPLVAVTIAQALRLSDIDRTLVTTDDPAVVALASDLGATVVERPSALAGDDALTVDAVLHALAVVGAVSEDVVVVLQPTSPFRADGDVEAALEALGPEGSAVSAVVPSEHPLKALIERDGVFGAILDPADLESPRQRLPRAAYPNGAVYVARYGDIATRRTLLVTPIRVVEMPVDRSHDIDTPADLEAARAMAGDRPTGVDRPAGGAGR